ncbi:MAG: formyl-CoA transferase [Hydrogenophaga sp. SCN 70-13]|uniref:CaiB/BaiF CoA transferase family protein n=1 Tax=unclassified Hydrogenophaga TaxID=2610897 RepID=UPI000869B88A|nr:MULTISPECIES: CaiB/BaiF CoA-transferase family protein [unclassified Hydrogenophaga]MBN9373682.1 CoA transferase [Hydrogenophaga sp.]ODT34409.1 MAG: formyl-CoA transferase [Hydrogenophaga sp. SCN 70-13]OJV67036.1 MAG: formyl-CoA transferase [Hydrogenophaga sp. 70-12]
MSPDTPDTLDTPATPPLPLAGIRVAEFSHMVMGPMCGMVLADLGAEVIKVEPPGGDNTRRLLGSGAGFFPLFNRNKKSLVLDLQTEEGREAALRLVATADVLVENFKPETMRKLGLDHESLRARFPRLIHVSHKGFLPGPYDHRTALDEVVQMMGGLAYMTGRPGDPLRAGSSVNDIMGGIFGAIGVLAALRERERSGRGQAVQSALFENNIFLVAQHMLQYAVTGAPANPMPQRISPWGIYDVFTAAGGDQIFLAVVSDTQWAIFCSAMGWADWRDDARLRTNNDRVRSRDWLIPELRARVAERPAAELAELFERHGLPFAPIAKPHELLDDPHLRATGGLAPITLPDGERAGQTVQTVPLPFTLGEQRLPVRSPPRLGADSAEVLRALGYDAASAERLSRTTAKG